MDVILNGIAAGSLALFDPMVIGLIILGTIFGVIIGSLPGLTSTMGVALLVPITFSMSPIYGLALLGAIYCSSTYAGAISAILINIPGTPSNCSTLLDGFPMTQKGQAGLALALATAASAIGGILSNVALLFLAPPLASLALMFGPMEYFLIALFGVSVIASLSEENMIKGFISGIAGLFLATIGMHPITGDLRFTLGIPELFSGLPLVVALIGLYSIPEVISSLMEKPGQVESTAPEVRGVFGQMFEIFKHKLVVIKSTIIGIVVGVIPGAGSSIAGFLAYDHVKKTSKDPSSFGQGNPDGVVSSEAANNAVVGGSLIPTLTLGIPGNAVSAVLLGGLMIHGLKPGPELFTDNMDVTYAFIMSMFISNIAFIPIGFVVAKFGVNLIKTPVSILGPLVITLGVVGSYALNTSLVDVWIMLAVGMLGYVMKVFDVPREPLVLGLVLGSMAEGELARALSLEHGSVAGLIQSMFTTPIALIIIGLMALSIGQGIRTQLKTKKI